MEWLLSIPIFIGFLVSFIALPFWIKRTKETKLTGKDLQKVNSEEVSEAGGVCVVLGFMLGILSYIALRTFYFDTYENTMEIFSLMVVVLIVAFVGFTDDIVGWKIGLSKGLRILFLIFASLPLLAINAGQVEQYVGIGMVYPLFLVVIGIVGATATFNFLAGYNGLETSQGILILSALSIINYFTGERWLSIIGLTMVAGLSAFYIFNKYPAKSFPGDVLTYAVGILIAVIAVFGSIELIAIFFFIPYILETLLKVRGKLKKESFAKVNPDESLELPYEKIYGLEHLAILILKKVKPSKKVYEKEVVYLINAFQLLIIIIGFIIFWKNIPGIPNLF